MLQLLSSLAKGRKLMLESFQVHQSEERVLNSNESGSRWWGWIAMENFNKHTNIRREKNSILLIFLFKHIFSGNVMI